MYNETINLIPIDNFQLLLSHYFLLTCFSCLCFSSYTYSVLSVVNSIKEYMIMKSYVVSQQFLGLAGELRKTGTVGVL